MKKWQGGSIYPFLHLNREKCLKQIECIMNTQDPTGHELTFKREV